MDVFVKIDFRSDFVPSSLVTHSTAARCRHYPSSLVPHAADLSSSQSVVLFLTQKPRAANYHTSSYDKPALVFFARKEVFPTFPSPSPQI